MLKTIVRFISCRFFGFHGLEQTGEFRGRCPWCGKTFDLTPLEP